MDVVVVGSLNRDVSVLTTRLPRPGETVTASGHFYGPGGKGANQAAAAARLGATVALVGRVGDDEHGRALVGGLREQGVDVSALAVDRDQGTGIAVITIDEDAENTIVVSPGANMRLSPADVEAHADLIADAAVVLAQLEVPAESVLAAARHTTGLFCLNPSPAHSVPGELLEWVDVLIPNRSELAALAGGEEPESVDDAVEMARGLGRSGPTVVTLGTDGAALVDGETTTVVPAPTVEAVDPTGAGDAFCGALARFLSAGRAIDEALPHAVAAGAVAVTRRGAQTAMPRLEEVEALLSG